MHPPGMVADSAAGGAPPTKSSARGRLAGWSRRWLFAALFVLWLVTPFGPTNSSEVGITPMQFSTDRTPFTGLPGVCTTTYVPIEIDGTFARVGPWENALLYPMTSRTEFIRCDNGEAVTLDSVRLEQTWGDPTCALAPRSDFAFALRGVYSPGVKDGYWINKQGGCIRAVGVAQRVDASTVEIADPAYRIVFGRGRSWSDRVCLAGVLRATVGLDGSQATADIAHQLSCLHRT